jgi:hypothetical protein
MTPARVARYGDIMRDFRRVHFVGIGGVGMSGIAEVLHNLGYRCPARTRPSRDDAPLAASACAIDAPRAGNVAGATCRGVERDQGRQPRAARRARTRACR